MRKTLRVAAYAVVVRDGQILLALSPADGGGYEWVLPGGGMEHGEDPLRHGPRRAHGGDGLPSFIRRALGFSPVVKRIS
jgi:8-oxo-dGTP pyrophosphatase MutT (NUDIX family)